MVAVSHVRNQIFTTMVTAGLMSTLNLHEMLEEALVVHFGCKKAQQSKLGVQPLKTCILASSTGESCEAQRKASPSEEWSPLLVSQSQTHWCICILLGVSWDSSGSVKIRAWAALTMDEKGGD
nr:PREDICTED: uncharacterized protein LOC107075641 isoform X2 [Lepisosteus oculatus]